MLGPPLAALLAASLLVAPVAGATVDACRIADPVPCVPSGNAWLDGTCGEASPVQGFVMTSVEILLVALGLGCTPASVALP